MKTIEELKSDNEKLINFLLAIQEIIANRKEWVNLNPDWNLLVVKEIDKIITETT